MKIRILPQEIATQIVLLLILSAIIFHLCISAAFFIGRGYPLFNERTQESGFVGHIADFLKLADEQPVPTRDHLLTWLADTDRRLDLKREPLPEPASAGLQPDTLIETLQSRIGSHIHVSRIESDAGRPRIGFQLSDGTSFSIRIPPPPRESDPRRPSDPPGPPGPRDGFFHDGPPPPPPDGPAGMIPMVFATLFFIAISFTIFLLWAVRGVMRPLRKFAATVDNFTGDGAVTLLEENGPSELRGAARALNRMCERVKAMIEQRTQMLAAISHDLRTPITRLRLRAEFIEHADVREPILRDIEQMDAMVHSALSFIRDGVKVQRNTLLDLSALIQTVGDEFVDMGYRVIYEPSTAISIKGNAEELYRAVTNLVSNAVRFGAEVEVHLRQMKDLVEIDVVDDGPGIPAEQKSAMLSPFARGDSARASDKLQGFGLGLPIVQTIVNAHRGSLSLLDREPHGLIARIVLPCR